MWAAIKAPSLVNNYRTLNVPASDFHKPLPPKWQEALTMNKNDAIFRCDDHTPGVDLDAIAQDLKSGSIPPGGPQANRRAVAAVEFVSLHYLDPGVDIDFQLMVRTQLSAFLGLQVLVKCTADNRFYITLGAAKWCAMAWPLRKFTETDKVELHQNSMICMCVLLHVCKCVCVCVCMRVCVCVCMCVCLCLCLCLCLRLRLRLYV